MPYCPHCGAEYGEDITACHECQVPLVDERPEGVHPFRLLPEPPPAVQGLWQQLLQAGRYAREAARLLWRRPGLLWLPLLVVVLNAIEVEVGQHLALTRTQWGQEARGWQQTPSAEEYLKRSAREQLRPDLFVPRAGLKAVHRFPDPVPSPTLDGLTSLVSVSLVSRSRGEMIPTPPLDLLAIFALRFVVLAPLAALFLSGYYGRLRSTVEASSSHQATFWSAVEADFWRFFAFLALLLALSGVLSSAFSYLVGPDFGPLADGPQPWVRSLLSVLADWLPLLLLVPLALSLPAISLDNLGLGEAVRRSWVTMKRQWPLGLALLVLAFLGTLVLTYPIALAVYSCEPASALDLFTLSPARALFFAISGAALALVGIWLALAQFLWYRAAYPAPLATVPEDGTPIVEG